MPLLKRYAEWDLSFAFFMVQAIHICCVLCGCGVRLEARFHRQEGLPSACASHFAGRSLYLVA